MPKVLGVAFLGNNKKYYFGSLPNLVMGDRVVVDTARGLEVGTIIEEEKEITNEEVIGELKNVQRKATKKDIEDYERNLNEKPQIYEKCKELIDESKLEMKLLDAEYTLDRTKLIVYFSAEGRVDFRDLVKNIAQVYKTRIELRQVGSRDASRILGGIGECGRVTCCSTFLGEMQNVTIKMAKNQSLSLNPTAISGLCGKLLCCIAFEDEVYVERQKELNNKDKEVENITSVDSNSEEEVVVVSTK